MDPEVKKNVLRQISYGMYVLTGSAGGDVAAASVTWLSQASFSPPLVMVCLRTDSHIHTVVEQSRAFAVNVVAAEQQELAAAFFRPSQKENGRLNGYAVEAGPATGAPLLLDAPAWFEARVLDVVKRGDHSIFVAEVVEAGLRNSDAKPMQLSETSWSYGG